MQFSLEHRTASLGVGEFSDFGTGPREAGGGMQGLWRAQLGQHWHNELRARTAADSPAALFEVVIEGRLTRQGWTLSLSGRIDQLLPAGCRAGSPTPPDLAGSGDPALHRMTDPLLREIKTVTRPLPADETALRADYPAYFVQLATYLVLQRALGVKEPRAELVFVEASSGLSQAVALTPFDEAIVHHQLDVVVGFLNQRLHATARRRALQFSSPFPSLRPGQETIQADLAAAFGDDDGPKSKDKTTVPAPSTFDFRPSTVLLFEAPTGYGKTGCVLEFALGRLQADRFERLVWLTGKSTGQLQVVRTLQDMTAASPLPVWQVRNKSEHCVNHVYHCLRDACSFLDGAAERWPASGLARFHIDEKHPRDLDTLRAAGRDSRICPYEITRTALAFQDVWIGDYNYVFAPDNRGLFGDQPGYDPARTLLVVDEAHNLPSRVADAHSHTIRAGDVAALQAELEHQRASAPLQLAVDEWARLLGSLRPCESLDPALEAELHDLLVRLAGLVVAQPPDFAVLGPQHSETLWQAQALADWTDESTLTRLLWVPREGELFFTCLDAAPVIGGILRGFGSAILMSATLSPSDAIAASCGLESPAVLRAPAPWRDGAYDVGADVRVDTTLRERIRHHGTTAATIEAMHGAARGPVAVYFPSYAYAESVLRALENNGSVLRAVMQPRLPDLAAQNAWVEENLALADALLLVLGGSFAEGIDLLGGRVTHAVIVSPALPEVNTVQRTRMSALERAGLSRDAAFRRVYQVPGLQKVNQALGRLVRAPGQRAKVLLHCRRFAEPAYASLLAPEYQFGREITDDAGLRDWLAG